MKKTLILFALIMLGLNTAPAALFNNAVKFYSAHNTYISIPSACLSGVSDRLTLEAWVKPDAAFMTGRIIDHCTAGGSDGVLLDLYNGSPRIIVGSLGVTSTSALSADTWYHLAATYDGSTVRLYLNGVLDNSAALSGSVPYNVGLDVHIGNDQSNGNQFSGLIDEVRIWKTALTKSYINTTMSTRLNGTEHGLAGYWPFQESGPTVTTVDQTSNHNNGTLINFLFDANDGFVINPPGLALSSPNSTVSLSGSGSGADPYLVGNYTDLTAVGAPYELNAVYRLSGDIDATASNSGAGYQPIGDNDTRFTGTFHGGGYKITDLHINRGTTDYVGLFGYIAGAAVVDSLGLESAVITGKTNTGGLAGRIGGTVSACYVKGAIVGTTSVGGFAGVVDGGTVSNCYTTATVNASIDVGGFTGDNVSSGSIIECYCAANVTGGTDNTTWVSGGLVGWNDATSSIRRSYATGDVTGYSGVGGLVGSDYGTITDCYATGSVTGTTTVGGLVGGGRSSAVITNCYTVGAVSGSTYTDAFLGQLASSTINNCFYNSAITPNGVAGTGKSESELKTNLTFLSAGWSFAVWNRDDGTNNGYPYLKWQNPAGTPLPVELSSFSIAPSADGAILKWKTATEVNNSGFTIERRSSLSGWTELGFVKGVGTSTSPREYSFKDAAVSSGSYVYRLKQIDNGGSFKYSGEATVTIEVPHVFSLDQNYPNPFNPNTTINFTLVEDGHVSLKVFDVVGREVAVLVSENLKAGELHSVMFNASNLSSGVYFYRLQAGKNSMVKKLLLAK